MVRRKEVYITKIGTLLWGWWSMMYSLGNVCERGENTMVATVTKEKGRLWLAVRV